MGFGGKDKGELYLLSTVVGSGGVFPHVAKHEKSGKA